MVGGWSVVGGWLKFKIKYQWVVYGRWLIKIKNLKMFVYVVNTSVVDGECVIMIKI